MTTTKFDRRQALGRLKEAVEELQAHPELLEGPAPTAAEKERQKAVGIIKEALRDLDALSLLVAGLINLHRDMGSPELGDNMEVFPVTFRFMGDMGAAISVYQTSIQEHLPLLVPELAGDNT
jgi:hypothetical protein